VARRSHGSPQAPLKRGGCGTGGLDRGATLLASPCRAPRGEERIDCPQQRIDTPLRQLVDEGQPFKKPLAGRSQIIGLLRRTTAEELVGGDAEGVGDSGGGVGVREDLVGFVARHECLGRAGCLGALDLGQAFFFS
jgi:hypothetical protein